MPEREATYPGLRATPVTWLGRSLALYHCCAGEYFQVQFCRAKSRGSRGLAARSQTALYTSVDLSEIGRVCDTSSSDVELRSLLKDEREVSKEAQAICDALNEYRLPRAIVHLGRDRFIAWNVSFQERTGYPAEQLHFAHLKDLVAFSEPDPELPENALQPTPGVHLVRCTTRCSGQEHFATGYAARRDDEFVLLMLDVINPSTGAIEDARLFGREEERNRILKLFHDRVSPKFLAAVFEVVNAKEKLEAKGLEESKVVAKAAEKLAETIDAVVSVLDPDHPAQAGGV